MTQLACPACGAGLTFGNKATFFKVCDFCRSLVVRLGDQDYLLDRGKVGALQDELTPLQIGTAGVYRGKAFDLLGRVQRIWDGGLWSEWYAMFHDERPAWLAQAQGCYTMIFPWSIPEGFLTQDDVRKLRPGAHVPIGQNTFQVLDIKTSRALSYEGELPAIAVQDGELLTLDLAREDRRFATLEVNARGEMSLFVGESVSFEDLSFVHLRALDGW